MCKKMTYLISFVLVLCLARGVESAEPFEQDPGLDGIVCIEAENFDDNILKGVSYWEFVTSTAVFTPADGFSGGAAMQSMPELSGKFRKDRATLCLDSRLRHGWQFRLLPCWSRRRGNTTF